MGTGFFIDHVVGEFLLLVAASDVAANSHGPWRKSNLPRDLGQLIPPGIFFARRDVQITDVAFAKATFVDLGTQSSPTSLGRSVTTLARVGEPFVAPKPPFLPSAAITAGGIVTAEKSYADAARHISANSAWLGPSPHRFHPVAG